MAYFERPEKLLIAPKRKVYLLRLSPLETLNELKPNEVIYKQEHLDATVIDVDDIVDKRRAKSMGKIVLRHVINQEDVQPVFVAASKLDNQLRLEATDGNHRITGYIDLCQEKHLPNRPIYSDVSYGQDRYDILYAKITAGTSINAIKFARNMRWLVDLYDLTGYQEHVSLYQAFVMTWQKLSGRDILSDQPELAAEIKVWVEDISSVINREVGTIAQYLAVMEVASPRLVEQTRVGSSYAKGEGFLNINQLGLIARAFPKRRGYRIQEAIFDYVADKKLGNDDIKKILVAVEARGIADRHDITTYLAKGAWRRTVTPVPRRYHEQITEITEAEITEIGPNLEPNGDHNLDDLTVDPPDDSSMLPQDLRVLSAESEAATTAILSTMEAIVHRSRQRHFPALDEALNCLTSSPGFAQEIIDDPKARDKFFTKIQRLGLEPQQNFPSQLIPYCLNPSSVVRDAASKLFGEMDITLPDRGHEVIESVQTELWNQTTSKPIDRTTTSEIIDAFLPTLSKILHLPDVDSEQAKNTFELLRLVSKQGDTLCQDGVEKFIREISSKVWERSKKPLAITEAESLPQRFELIA